MTKKKEEVWYKCLRCVSKCKKQSGLKETFLCPQCGELSAYYVKEMRG